MCFSLLTLEMIKVDDCRAILQNLHESTESKTDVFVKHLDFEGIVIAWPINVHR